MLTLLKQIVGGIVMKDWFLAFGTICLPIAFTLITFKAIAPSSPDLLYYAGSLAAVLGFYTFYVALKRAQKDDDLAKSDRDELHQIFKDLRGETKDVNKNLNTLIGEIRKDRDDRNKKHKP